VGPPGKSKPEKASKVGVDSHGYWAKRDLPVGRHVRIIEKREKRDKAYSLGPSRENRLGYFPNNGRDEKKSCNHLGGGPTF